MTPAQARRLKRMINRLVAAERDLSWIGVQDPRDHAAIRKEHLLAKHALDTYIHHLTVAEKAVEVPKELP